MVLFSIYREVLTLMLCADYIPYPGEQQFLAYLRANYGALFPKLPDQSQFNRRCRSLRHLLEALRRDWLNELGGYRQGIICWIQNRLRLWVTNGVNRSVISPVKPIMAIVTVANCITGATNWLC